MASITTRTSHYGRFTMSGTGYILLAIRVDRDDDAGELLAVAVGGPPQAWPMLGAQIRL